MGQNGKASLILQQRQREEDNGICLREMNNGAVSPVPARVGFTQNPEVDGDNTTLSAAARIIQEAEHWRLLQATMPSLFNLPVAQWLMGRPPSPPPPVPEVPEEDPPPCRVYEYDAGLSGSPLPIWVVTADRYNNQNQYKGRYTNYLFGSMKQTTDIAMDIMVDAVLEQYSTPETPFPLAEIYETPRLVARSLGIYVDPQVLANDRRFHNYSIAGWSQEGTTGTDHHKSAFLITFYDENEAEAASLVNLYGAWVQTRHAETLLSALEHYESRFDLRAQSELFSDVRVPARMTQLPLHPSRVEALKGQVALTGPPYTGFDPAQTPIRKRKKGKKRRRGRR